MELTLAIGGVTETPLVDGSSITKEISQRQSKATLKFNASGGFRINESKLGVDAFGLTLQELDSVVVTDGGGTKHFNGFVTAIKESWKARNLREFEAEANDHTWLLSTATITKTYTAQSDRAIIQDLLTTVGLAPDISTLDANVDIVEASLTVTFEDKTARDALDELAALTGAEWHVDQDAALHYNLEANAGAAAFDVSDAPDLSSTFKYEQLGFQRRFQRPINQVNVLGGWDNSGNRIDVTRDDLTSQAAFGRVFKQTIVNFDINTTALANLLGDVILARQANPEESAKFRVRRDGLEVNKLIEVTSRDFGLTAKSMLIRRIALSQVAGSKTVYEVEVGENVPKNDRQLRLLEKQSRERTGTPQAVPPIGSITETMITNDAISTPKLQANAITAVKVAADAITGDKILAGSIEAADAVFAAAAIKNADIDTLAVEKLIGTLISGKEFVLTSSPNTMRINGTDGFRQENTTSGRDIRLKDGQLVAINPSSIVVAEIDANGGSIGGQANSGALVIRNAAGTLAGSLGTELAATGGFLLLSGLGAGNVGCLVRAGSIANAGVSIDGQKILSKNILEIRDSSGSTRRGRIDIVSSQGRLALSSSVDEVLIQAKAGSNLGDSFEIRNSAGTARVKIGVVAAGANGSIGLFGGTTCDIRSGTTGQAGLYVGGTRVVGPQGTDPGLNPTTEQLRQIMLTHGLI